MTKEEARCRMAFECCIQGKNTAMICSGDSGVYGMAGLILELAPQYPGVEIKMILVLQLPARAQQGLEHR